MTFILTTKREADAQVSTSLGDFHIFGLTAGNAEKLRNEINCSLEKCSPEEYIRILSLFICYPKDKLLEGKYRPEEPILTKDDTNKFTIMDLEAIAEKYVENNDYLYTNSKLVENIDNDGNKTYKRGKKEIEYPRSENESFVDYTHRVTVLYEKNESEKIKKRLGSILGVSSFSSQLTENIGKTVSKGNLISNIVSNIGESRYESIADNFLRLEHLKEQNRAQPINELSKKLDQLINLTSQSSEFIVEMNETQIQIASEIKKSSDQSQKSSRNNIYVFY
jgi:hypothetical protein